MSIHSSIARLFGSSTDSEVSTCRDDVLGSRRGQVVLVGSLLLSSKMLVMSLQTLLEAS